MGLAAQRLGAPTTGGSGYGAASRSGGPTATQQALAATGLTEAELLKYREPEENRRPGVLGAILDTGLNVFGDVAEMAEGLVDLGATVGSDIARLAPGGEAGNYKLDDFVKNIPSALHQYGKSQYGVDPLKGDIWPEKLPTAIREDPLNTALDILGTGALAGKVANAIIKPATLRALRAGTAPAELPAISKRLLPGVNPQSRYFDEPTIGRGVDRSLGRQRLTEQQIENLRFGGYRPRLELGSEPQLEAPAWSRSFGMHENFFRRGVSQAFYRSITRPVADLGVDATKAAEAIKKGRSLDDYAQEMGLMRSQAAHLYSRGRILEAAERYNVGRVYHEGIGARLLKRTAAQFTGAHTSNVIAARNESHAALAKSFDHFFRRLRETGMKPHEAAGWVEKVQPYLEGVLATGVAVSRMSLDDAVRYLTDPQTIAAFDAAGQGGELAQLTRGFSRLKNMKRDLQLEARNLDLARREAFKSGVDLDERLELFRQFNDVQTELDALERFSSHVSEVLHWRDRVPSTEMEAVAELAARVRWDRLDEVLEGVDAADLPRGAGLTFRSQMASAYGPQFLEPSKGLVKVGLNKDGTVRYSRRQGHGGIPEEDLRAAFAADKRSLEALFEDDPTYWSRLDDALGDAPAPVYYPQFNPDKVRAADFMGIGKKLQGAARQNLGPFNARTYYNFLNGQTQRDALQAYAWASARTRSIVGTQKFVHAYATRFGRRIRSMDEATDFEVIYNPWLLKQHYMNQAVLDRYISSALDDGLPLAEAARTAVKRAERMLDEFGENWDPAIHGKEMYAIPRHVADQLEEFSKYRVGQTGGTLFLNRSTDLWRSLVLAYSPRWIVNNLLGNTFFAKMMGLPLSRVATMAVSKAAHEQRTTFGRILRKAGVSGKRAALLEEILAKADPDLVRSINAGFHTPAQQHLRQLGRFESTMAGQVVVWAEEKSAKVARRRQGMATYNPLRIDVKKTITNWNTHIEDLFRQTAFIHDYERLASLNRVKKVGDQWWRSVAHMERIAKEGLDEATAREAVRRTNFFFNDYRQLSPIERNIVRPYVAPFWGFWKHVNLLNLKFPFEAPERALVMRQLAEFARQEMLEDATALTDEYRLHGLTENPTGIGGDVLSFKAAIPLSAAAEFMRSPHQSGSGLLGPAPGALVEFISGRDFIGRPFEQEGTFRPFGTDQSFAFTRDSQQNITGVSPIDVRQNPGQVLWGQVPQLGILGALLSGETRYGTTTSRPAEIGRFFGFSTLNPVSEESLEYKMGVLQRALALGAKEMAEGR